MHRCMLVPSGTITSVLHRRCPQSRFMTASKTTYLRYLPRPPRCLAVNPRRACEASCRGAGRLVLLPSVQIHRSYMVDQLQHPGITPGIRQVPLHVPSHHTCLGSDPDLIAIGQHRSRTRRILTELAHNNKRPGVGQTLLGTLLPFSKPIL